MDGNEKIQPLDHSRLDQNRQVTYVVEFTIYARALTLLILYR